MDIETNENGDVIIKADESAKVEGTVETVLEAATEIAEKIEEARQEGDKTEQALILADVTLTTLNARFDGLESRISAMFDLLADIRGAQIVDQIVEDEILDEIVEAVDTPPAPTEIVVEENNGTVEVETVEPATAPEIRPSKKARFI